MRAGGVPGWLAGWLKNWWACRVRVGGGGCFLLYSQINQCLSFVYLKVCSKTNSDAELLSMALLGFQETGGFSTACCGVETCS